MCDVECAACFPFDVKWFALLVHCGVVDIVLSDRQEKHKEATGQRRRRQNRLPSPLNIPRICDEFLKTLKNPKSLQMLRISVTFRCCSKSASDIVRAASCQCWLIAEPTFLHHLPKSLVDNQLFLETTDEHHTPLVLRLDQRVLFGEFPESPHTIRKTTA